ncbi:crosslink repair DNA glycosylase YcaQ family protein [Sphaerisporangium sp. B11E5]|uniref:DNA glycosylase AlkZ-like family protein n=1 Tax=Sphaerisporangium sp. B11E5 TaxID=3153563 RepID=UPI00325DC08B
MAERSAPATVGSYTLDAQEADRLWNWVLTRQGLAAHTRGESVEQIAEAALGLHAARLPSPFATVAARAKDPAIALSLFTPATRSRVVTLRCMRKTLHTLPLGLAAAAHAATLRFRERDALRILVNAGHTEHSTAPATKALIELLGENGPLHHRDIETRLATAAIPVPLTRLALKLAWERGTLTYLNGAAGWNREVRTFALTARTYPALQTDLPAPVAVERLISAYLDRYGPVSIRDATWWSGLSRTAVLNGIERCGVKLIELRSPWSDNPLYMPEERFNKFIDSSELDHTTGIHLLGHEDVALKAYFETRARYLRDLSASTAFNQIGEVLPTIIHNGHVIGTWAWHQPTGEIRARLVPRATTPDQRKHIHAAASKHTQVLHAGRTAGPSPGPAQMVLPPAADALFG